MFPEYHERVHISIGQTIEYTPIQVCSDCGRTRFAGDWPQCPHETGCFGEDPLEPYVDMNLCENPVEVTTRGERRAIMNRQHMEYRPKRFDLIHGRRTYFDQGKRG